MNGPLETTVEILGKFYQIKCPPEELPILKKSSAWLNEKMRQFRAQCHTTQPEIIAIMSALNIAQEYFNLQEEKQIEIQRINQRLQQLGGQIKDALHLEPESLTIDTFP